MSNIAIDVTRIGRADGQAPTPRYCVMWGDDCWGAPNVRMNLADGWYCYISAGAWGTLLDADKEELRERLISALPTHESKKTEPKKAKE